MQLCPNRQMQPVHPSCTQDTHAHALACTQDVTCIQHPVLSILLLIDALNPGSRDKEMQAVAVGSCFVSAILSNICAPPETLLVG